MILADTNFWLALVLSKHDFHRMAIEWFEKQTAPRSVLFCRSTQQSFLRLLTTEVVLRRYAIPPMTNTAAWATYEGVQINRRCGFTDEPGGLQERWKRYASRDSASPKLWMDSYLAAFATTGKHRLVTIDNGFRQFEELDAIILS